MSISIETYPPLVALARNQLTFKFLTDNYIITAGVIARYQLYFSPPGNHLVDGDSFDLLWGNVNITIEVKTNPDDSGTQIKEYTSGSFNAWVILTKSYLEQNYYLSRDFFLTTSMNTIIFIARETGTGYDMTLDNEPPAKININQITAGVDEVTRDFFSILLQTWVQNDPASFFLLEQKFEDALSIDENFEATADISEILKSELFSEFEFPEVSANSWVRRYNILKSYKLRYAEQYGNPLVPQGVSNSTIYYALNGGVPFWKQVEYYNAGTSFWDRMQVNWNFLTWQPAYKKIDKYQIEKLYFLAWKSTLNNTKCRLKITLYNCGIVPVIYSDEQSLTYLDVWELKVGYANLNALFNLDAYFDGTPGQYYTVEVTIKAGNTVISEKRSYEVDLTEYPNTRYFIFKNSLGGFDTFRNTGVVELTDDYDRTFISQSYSKEFDAAFKQKKSVFINGAHKYKGNTGWLTEEQQEWCQEMLLSDEVYEIISGVLYPVNIISTSIRKKADDESPAWQHEFEYERTAHDSTYAQGQQIISGGDFDPADFDPDDFSTE